MTADNDNLDAYVRSAAEVVGLPIPEDYRESVVANFRRLAAMAALVMDFPLPVDLEPASIYTLDDV